MDSCRGIPPDQITCPGLLSLRYSKDKSVSGSIFLFLVHQIYFFFSFPITLYSFCFFLDLGDQSISYFAFEIVAI